MTYLLDTDTCIDALRSVPAVRERLFALAPSEVAISVVTEGELRLGAEKSARRAHHEALVDAFVAAIAVLPVESSDARAYAKVRADLERRGKGIGPLDTWIAAQGLARGLVVVTRNVKEFSRVRDLRIEGWTR
jgi:tRNA(fMet)-specific endonuclease VapC